MDAIPSPKPRRAAWAQPSLSRDFALLSAAILFMMVLISAWVGWMTYRTHTENTVADLAAETQRIERLMGLEFETTGHVLTAVAKQIQLTAGSDPRAIAQILKTYDNSASHQAVWIWTDASGHLIASSQRGVLEEPIDVSDRDYVIKAQNQPGKIIIGEPIQGRVSNRWVIPVSIGVSDFTGQFLGTLEASVDVTVMTESIKQLTRRHGTSFAVVSKSFVPLTAVASSEEFVTSQLPLENLKRIDPEVMSDGLISSTSPFSRSGMYSYFRVSGEYPYIIVAGYEAAATDSAVRALLWPRLTSIILVSGFLLLLLFIIRARVIRPVVELSQVASGIVSGTTLPPVHAGTLEINQLSMQLARVVDYLEERKRLEDELRGKISLFQQRLQKTQLQGKSRAVLLAGALSDYKNGLRHILSQSQVMKDQLYGPIENKKYRQCASDIHQSGSTLDLNLRKLIALTRIDAGSMLNREEPVALARAVEQAALFVKDALEPGTAFELQTELGNAVEMNLRADFMHTQQALSYAMLYLLSENERPTQLLCRALPYPSTRDEGHHLLVLGSATIPAPTPTQAKEALNTPLLTMEGEEATGAHMHLMLAESLLTTQGMALGRYHGAEGTWLVLDIPAKRLWKVEE